MGILANSVDVTHTSSSSDDTKVGFVTGSRITLTTNPTASSYSWALGQPSDSAQVRSRLSDATGSSVSFTPDVAGLYNIVCTVDGSTVYILRISVTAAAISSLVDSLRHSPKTDTSVPAPAVGQAVFYSSDHGGICVKTAAGIVIPLLIGKIGAALANTDQTVAWSGGQIYVLPPSTLTANHTVTVTVTTAKRSFWIIRLDTGAFTFNVLNSNGGGTLYTGASATKYACKFTSDGTNIVLAEEWQLNG